MGDSEVDDIFTIDRVYHTIFTQIPDDLHLNHSARFMVTKLIEQLNYSELHGRARVHAKNLFRVPHTGTGRINDRTKKDRVEEQFCTP